MIREIVKTAIDLVCQLQKIEQPVLLGGAPGATHRVRRTRALLYRALHEILPEVSRYRMSQAIGISSSSFYKMLRNPLYPDDLFFDIEKQEIVDLVRQAHKEQS